MTKKERNELIYARHQEGYSQEEIGRFYNLSQSAISLIILNKKRNVPEKEEETRGAKSKMSKLQYEELKEVLNTQPASIIGFVHWDKWSIQALIKEKFGVSYHENYIWKIMKKIGFSSQVPQKKDYRQDAAKVEEFKSTKGLEIKKSES